LFEQVFELLTGPLREAPALVMAIMCGLRFAAASPATAPHIETVSVT
jgi:hypothetical protein